MELIFLLPLIAVFYLWNGASIRRSRTVQTLVSSHLLERYLAEESDS